MQPSVTMCRAQEAHQRSLAANAVLPNVRAIATLAAAAWAKEAAAASEPSPGLRPAHNASR